jgi:hypothetical protein
VWGAVRNTLHTHLINLRLHFFQPIFMKFAGIVGYGSKHNIIIKFE